MSEKDQKGLNRREFLKGAAVGISAISLSPLSDREARALPSNKVPGWDYEADVVAVGYGAAGGNAALAAHDEGAKVIILEKMPSAGGNSGISLGWMILPDNVNEAIKYFRALSFGRVDEDLVRGFAEALVGIPDLLKKLGGEFTIRKAPPPTFPALPGSNSITRLIQFKPTGVGGFKFLSDQVDKRGIRVMLKTPAKALIQIPETREVVGVKAESAGKDIYLKAAKGVVLTCGGYANNPEMVECFCFSGLSEFFTHAGNPGNTGDGVKMASSAGAELWHMSNYELWPAACAKAASREFGFGIGSGLGSAIPAGGFMFVNKYGRRFMNENKRLMYRKDPFEALTFNHEGAEYSNLPAYMIFDEAYRQKGPIASTSKAMERAFGGPVGYSFIHKVYDWSNENTREIEKGWILKADTIKDLAGKIKVDPAGLEATVAQFKNYWEAGKDPEFNRTKASLASIETPPYYAIELGFALLNTQGGPKHNQHCQVLDSENKPIPRLYAAGELGSFSGFLHQGGTNYPEAWAFGHIAGKRVAAEKPWSK
jgi:succinate dehydrogenase/fumarate reductase flavoprotein subunit